MYIEHTTMQGDTVKVERLPSQDLLAVMLPNPTPWECALIAWDLRQAGLMTCAKDRPRAG